jgi:hypothetical protein
MIRKIIFALIFLLSVSCGSDASQLGIGHGNIVTHGHSGPNDGGTIKLPVVRVSRTITQGLTCNINQPVFYNVETQDPLDVFNPASGKFTPNIPGWYLLTARDNVAGTSITSVYMYFYLNGSPISMNAGAIVNSTGATGVLEDIVYLNGTTDYIQVYVQVNAASGCSVYGAGINDVFASILLSH